MSHTSNHPDQPCPGCSEADEASFAMREERDPPLTKAEIEARQQRAARLGWIQSRVAQVIRDQSDAAV